MLDPAFGVRIVFAPQSDELVQMMRPQYGPVSGQVIEVVHDDRDEQVDDQERAEHVERNEIRKRDIGTATVVVGLFGLAIAKHLVWSVGARHHDVLPRFACGPNAEFELRTEGEAQKRGGVSSRIS